MRGTLTGIPWRAYPGGHRQSGEPAIRKALAAMLTLVAFAAATAAVTGCGGKSSGTTSKPATTTTHKQPSHAPGY
jgi:hypothetical protein